MNFFYYLDHGKPGFLPNIYVANRRSQRKIDLLFEEKEIYVSQKIWLGKFEIPATLFTCWETLCPVSKKVDVMKVF